MPDHPTALTDEANDWWDRVSTQARDALAATADPHPAERVKVCKFCHARYQGIRRTREYERSDGMLIAEYVQRCCGHHTPFRNGVQEDGWQMAWVAKDASTETHDEP